MMLVGQLLLATTSQRLNGFPPLEDDLFYGLLRTNMYSSFRKWNLDKHVFQGCYKKVVYCLLVYCKPEPRQNKKEKRKKDKKKKCLLFPKKKINGIIKV